MKYPFEPTEEKSSPKTSSLSPFRPLPSAYGSPSSSSPTLISSDSSVLLILSIGDAVALGFSIVKK